MATRRWIRLDIGFHRSDWIIPLSPESQLAWLRLLCYTKAEGVKGRVKSMSPKTAGLEWRLSADSVVSMLEAAESDDAISVEGSEWVVTNWEVYNPSDATSAARSRRYRNDKSRLSPLRTVTRDNAPSRRDPSRDKDSDIDSKEKNPAGSKRKTALSDGWTPTDAHREQAAGLGVDLGRCVEDFRDHAKGTGRLMKDWDATFRTWLRKAPEFAGNGRKPADEQAVADILLMVGDHAGDLQFLPRPQVLKAIEKAHPVHWSRSGRYMEKLKLGTISGMASKDREHEVRIQVRQLNGVV